MIKPNELRIGNYILQSLIGNGETLGKINHVHDLQLIEENPDKFNPIQLTEEWLKKFGFKYFKENSIGEGYSFGSLSIRLHNGSWCYIYGIGVRSETKYVHQLQNLYFALTGEELTIKEVNQ